jgi:hypothetical protein
LWSRPSFTDTHARLEHELWPYPAEVADSDLATIACVADFFTLCAIIAANTLGVQSITHNFTRTDFPHCLAWVTFDCNGRSELEIGRCFGGAGALETDELERLVGCRLRLDFEDIVNHPRLGDARRAYLDAFSRVYEGDPFLIRLLLDAGRFFVFHCAAVLDAAQDTSRRETWFTVSALKKELATFGFASGRHVDQLVRRLRDVGFLEQRQAAQDRRVQLLSTTDLLRSHHTQWLAAHYVPLATLYPQHDYSLVLSDDRAFQ